MSASEGYVPEPLSEELMAILVELKIPHTMGKLQKNCIYTLVDVAKYSVSRLQNALDIGLLVAEDLHEAASKAARLGREAAVAEAAAAEARKEENCVVFGDGKYCYSLGTTLFRMLSASGIPRPTSVSNITVDLLSPSLSHNVKELIMALMRFDPSTRLTAEPVSLAHPWLSGIED